MKTRFKLCAFSLLLTGLSWGQFSNGGGGSSPIGGPCAVQLYGTATTLDGDNTVLCGVIAALTPAAPTVTQQGAAGADTWSYCVVANNLIGSSACSADGTVVNGAAVLSGTDFNRVTTVAVPGSTSCDIYITAAPGGGSTGLIDSGNACGAVFDDLTGLGDGNNPPSADTTVGLFDAGNLIVRGHSAMGAQGALNGGSIFGRLTSVVLDLEETMTGDLSSEGVGILGVVNADPSVDGAFVSAGNFIVQSDPGNATHFTFLVGFQNTIDHQGTGIVDDIQASAFPILNSNTGMLSDARAVETLIANLGMGDITMARHVRVTSTSNPGGGTVTSNLGVDIEDQSAVGSTLALNMRSQGSASVNSLEGRATWGPHSLAGIGGLPTVDGDQIYCENCTVTSAIDNTCAGGGTGSQVFQLNGVLKCFQ